MTYLIKIKRAIHSFEQFFIEATKIRALQPSPIPFEKHCEKSYAVLIATLTTCLDAMDHPNEAIQTIRVEFQIVMERIAHNLANTLSLADLSTLIDFNNLQQPLQAIYQFNISSTSNRRGIRIFDRGESKSSAPLIKMRPLLWPLNYEPPIPENAPFELIDKILRQVLATPTEFDAQTGFINKLIAHQFKMTNSFTKPENYAYQILQYVKSHYYTDFEKIKAAVLRISDSAYPSDAYPLKMLDHFANHAEFHAYNEIILLYQGIVLYNKNVTCMQLINHIKTPEQARFVFDLLWSNKSFLQDNEKLKAFLASEKLCAYLIKQINEAKGETLFSTAIKTRILTIATSHPGDVGRILETCHKEMGEFFLRDPEIFQQLEHDPQIRQICIAKDFSLHHSLLWLKNFQLSTADCVALIIKSKNHASNSELIKLLREQFAKAVLADLYKNPPKLQELLSEIRKLLTTDKFPKKLSTMLLSTITDVFINHESILEFAQRSHPFQPVAEALLSVSEICGYLIAEIISHNNETFLSSNEFLPWLTLSSEATTTLVQADEIIKHAVIARNDFARNVINVTKDDSLAIHLVEHSELTLSDITTLFANKALSPSVIRALTKKSRQLLPGNHSTQEIIQFLLALNYFAEHLQLSESDEIHITTQLKQDIHELFTNADLKETLWISLFAKHYARHPNDLANNSMNDEQQALILIAHLAIKTKPLPTYLLTANVALHMLNKTAEFNDTQYLEILNWIKETPFFNPAFICRMLSTACNSLARAKLICQILPCPPAMIYELLEQYTETEQALQFIALRYLLLGTVLNEQSLLAVKGIYGVRGYLLAADEQYIPVTKVLEIFQKDHGTLALNEIHHLLKSHPNLSIADFKTIRYHFLAEDLLFIVASIPHLNLELTHYLLHSYCTMNHCLHAYQLQEIAIRTLRRLFNQQIINDVLIKLFQTSYFTHKPQSGKEVYCLPLSEYERLCQTNNLFKAQRNREGDDGLFARNKECAIVSASWYADSKARLTQDLAKLKELRLHGLLREQLYDSDLVALNISSEEEAPPLDVLAW